MDSPQNLFRIGALIVVAVMAAGCSFNVARLPAPAEFSKPMSVLVEEYPDLTRVFPEYSTSDHMGMAFADAFIAAWGEPYEKQLTWWNLWPGRRGSRSQNPARRTSRKRKKPATSML